MGSDNKNNKNDLSAKLAMSRSKITALEKEVGQLKRENKSLKEKIE